MAKLAELGIKVAMTVGCVSVDGVTVASANTVGVDSGKRVGCCDGSTPTWDGNGVAVSGVLVGDITTGGTSVVSGLCGVCSGRISVGVLSRVAVA